MSKSLNLGSHTMHRMMKAMPQTEHSLDVEPYDHPLRYLVKSASRPDIQHLVDLSGYNTNGECSCEHFCMRIQPNLSRQTKVTPSPKTQCRHIRAVREERLNSWLTAFVNKEKHHEQQRNTSVG